MEQLLGTSVGVLIGLTIVITGGAAVLAGRAIAGNWKPVSHVIFACFGLGLADRFLVYALFEGTLLHLGGFLIHLAVITIMALVAYRIMAVRKMVNQYPWRYEQASLWRYRERKAAA